jgi:transcriptional regulator with XRE-family HTH domain
MNTARNSEIIEPQVGPLLALVAQGPTLCVMENKRRRRTNPPSRQGVTRDQNALRRLILKRMAELDINYVELARRGGWPSHSTVYALVNRTDHKQVPRRETLQRLAKAISVPLDVVEVAAGETMGYHFDDISTTLDAASDVRIVAASMTELTQEQREQIVRLATTLLEQGQSDTAAETSQG